MCSCATGGICVIQTGGQLALVVIAGYRMVAGSPLLTILQYGRYGRYSENIGSPQLNWIIEMMYFIYKYKQKTKQEICLVSSYILSPSSPFCVSTQL